MVSIINTCQEDGDIVNELASEIIGSKLMDKFAVKKIYRMPSSSQYIARLIFSAYVIRFLSNPCTQRV